MEENEPVYIELADALEFYAAIIGGTLGQAADQLRDQAGLESALGRPRNYAHYKRPTSRCRRRHLRTASPRARHSSTETSAWRLFQC